MDLMLRVGIAPYEDGFGEICKLRQTTTVIDYQNRFERLLGKVRVANRLAGNGLLHPWLEGTSKD